MLPIIRYFLLGVDYHRSNYNLNLLQLQLCGFAFEFAGKRDGHQLHRNRATLFELLTLSQSLQCVGDVHEEPGLLVLMRSSGWGWACSRGCGAGCSWACGWACGPGWGSASGWACGRGRGPACGWAWGRGCGRRWGWRFGGGPPSEGSKAAGLLRTFGRLRAIWVRQINAHHDR